MERIYKYKLPINVGDTVYGFYKNVYEHKIERIIVYISLRRDTNTGGSSSEVSWRFCWGNCSIEPAYLGSEYFKSKSDLKKLLLSHQPTHYEDTSDIEVPIKYDLGIKIYVIDGDQIAECKIHAIEVKYIIDADEGNSTRIRYEIVDGSGHHKDTITLEEFGESWDVDKERLINRVLGL